MSAQLASWLGDQIGEGKRFESNSELARASDLSEYTVRRLLAGEEPSLRTLRKLANGLKYPLDELQKMAGILADDKGVRDDLINYINAGLKLLPESDRRHILKLVNSMVEEHTRGGDSSQR